MLSVIICPLLLPTSLISQNTASRWIFELILIPLVQFTTYFNPTHLFLVHTVIRMSKVFFSNFDHATGS